MTTLLCDECQKNKATVHLTEIVNEQVTKLNLCELCAKKKGAEAEQHFGIADLLSALTDVEHPHPQPTTIAGSSSTTVPAGTSKNKCAACGLTYDDFKKIGRLGCAECYKAFKTSLTPLLKRIHGSNQHVGKSPTPSAQDEIKVTHKRYEELEQVKTDLAKAVKSEEFEVAAALRDKIKFIEKKLKGTK